VTLTGDDPALLYGASVFTTLRIYQGCLEHPLVYWQAHCDRIRQSLQALGWPEPDWQRVHQGCIALLPIYPVLRLAIFPDGRELISGRHLPADLAIAQQQGVTAWVAPPYQRAFPEHKTGNYLGSWLALQAAHHRGAREAILVNAQGHWLETSTGTLWGWRAGQWWTPPLAAGILPGIIRQALVDRLSVIQQPWTSAIVARFEALAYTNCVVEMLPVRTVFNGNTTLEYNPDCVGFERLRSLFSGKLTGS
jgi:4-amino-4-deoxychorismate lyase